MVGHPRTMASATRRVRAMCATSCTRTMSAPDAMARATVAAVASTRSSGGAPSSSSPRNRFRLVPTSSGSPPSAAFSSASRWSSSRFSAVPLPKPMPGSTMIRSRATPRSMAASTADRSQPVDGLEDAGRVARLLLVVHQDEVRVRLGRCDGRVRIAGGGPDVVHHAGAGRQRRARHLPLRRVDADDGAVANRLRDGPDDRDGEGGLRRLVDRRAIAVRGSWPGRLRAHVEDLGAGRDEAGGLLDGGRDDGVDPAIGRRQPVAGERVGGHVQDAHHVGPLAPCQPRFHHASSPLPVSMPRTAPTR